jgi:hypothetical protein
MKDMKVMSREDIDRLSTLHSKIQELVARVNILDLNALLDELDYIYRK